MQRWTWLTLTRALNSESYFEQGKIRGRTGTTLDHVGFSFPDLGARMTIYQVKIQTMYKTLIVTGLLVVLSGSQFASAENVGGIDRQDKTITLTLFQEPRSLNSLTAESVSYTAQLMVHVQEGLMRYDHRRKLTGGVAERWQETPGELRFWLRSEATWQDGNPVKAGDFVYAWQQLVSPDTASPSANLASPIKNASRILKGEMPISDLGVVAINDKELLVILEHPCAWCLKLMTNSIFYPVNQDFYEKQGESYGTSAASHLSNGAFKIKQWQRGKNIHLTKNERYWGSGRVYLNNIRFDYIGSDAKTILNLFRAGEIAVANLDRDTIPEALEQGFRLRTYPSGHLFNIQFSHVAGMLSANENLRKAISLVIDKQELVNRVVASPGTRIADSMFHDWLTIGNVTYAKERPPVPHKVDLEKAKQHLQLAEKELSLNGEIELTLTINDSDLYRRIAEYMQQRLSTHLGIRVNIDPQITQMMVEKWRTGTSDMTLITWPVDVDDPMDQISFMGNPDFRAVFQGLYKGDDMAALYVRNKNAIETEERIDAVNAVHELFNNRVTVLPLFESYGVSTINPSLRGFIWQPVRGYADFRYVKIR